MSLFKSKCQQRIKLKVQAFDGKTIVDNQQIFFDNKIHGEDKYQKQFYSLLEPDNSYTTQKSKLFVLTDVYVLFPYGLVFKDGKVLDESIYNVNIDREINKEDRSLSITLDVCKENAIYTEEPSFLMAGGFSDNYYHWHVDILTRLAALNDLDVKNLSIYFNQLNTYQKASLKFMKGFLKGHKCVFAKGKTFFNKSGTLYKFKELYYTPFYMGKFPRLSDRLPLFYNEVKKQLIPSGNMGTERIYISRGKNKRRVLINEDELITVLSEKWGFLIINPEEYTYEEQIKLFSCCQIMLGSHGAGFTNMIFSGSETIVIELFSDKYINIGLQRLALAKGLEYHYIVGNTISFQEDDIHALQYEINIDEVTTKLKAILNSSSL